MPNLNPPGNADPKLPTAKSESRPAYIVAEDSGLAISHRSEDRKPLLLRLAQNNSLFIADVPGAKPGDYVITDLMRTYDGEVGLSVVPFLMRRVWMGWYVGRMGYADRYLDKPNDLVQTISQEGARPKRTFTRDNGNIVVEETIEVWMLLDGQPVMSPWKSTFITVARHWMTVASQFRTAEGELPLFGRHYKLTSKTRSTGSLRWFIPAFADQGFTPRDDYLLAKEFFEIARRGALRIDMSGESADAA
jgi:hypothetical protein